MKMKSTKPLSACAILLFITCLSGKIFSQDTLHLNYKGIETKMRDTTEAKIDAWVKKLNGIKVNVTIYGYYAEADFKQYATERADEAFLLVTRKARNLVNITSAEPKKGKKWQRGMVDIIYTSQALETVTKDKKEDQKDKKENTTVKEEPKAGTFDPSFGHPGTKSVGVGQLLKAADVKNIKTSRIVVAQIGDSKIDSALASAVKDHWNFTSEIQVMTYNKAATYAKEHENVLIFIVGNAKPTPPKLGEGPSVKYRTLTQGTAVMLEDKKGTVVASAYIPTYGLEAFVTPEAVAFGVTALNYELKVMDEKELVNNLNIYNNYKELAADKLKSKTLYIPEGWLNDKMNKSEIAGIYTAKSEVVNYSDWSSLITGKKEGAYLMVVPRPIVGNFVYQHYIVDATTGMVYAICYPKVASSLSKSNSGFVNDVNVKRYNDALKGEW